jgi:hypothetical protein
MIAYLHDMPSVIPISVNQTDCDISRRSAGSFTPDVVEAMGEAFDLAWTVLLAAGHPCATGPLETGTRYQLALAIVESARQGTRCRVQLSHRALRSFFPLGPV